MRKFGEAYPIALLAGRTFVLSSEFKWLRVRPEDGITLTYSDRLLHALEFFLVHDGGSRVWRRNVFKVELGWRTNQCVRVSGKSKGEQFSGTQVSIPSWVRLFKVFTEADLLEGLEKRQVVWATLLSSLANQSSACCCEVSNLGSCSLSWRSFVRRNPNGALWADSPDKPCICPKHTI